MGFKINRVYTRSGDSGETSLVDGSRVKKNHPSCVIFGGLDEVNSHLGLAKEASKNVGSLIDLYNVIEFLQQELFDLGSEVATPANFTYPEMWKASEASIIRLENLCDHYNKDLPELNSFILPGGNQIASHLHVARTVTRRVEREIVDAISNGHEISEFILIYINRLSDLLFVLSRYALDILKNDVPLWKKEANRKLPKHSN